MDVSMNRAGVTAGSVNRDSLVVDPERPLKVVDARKAMRLLALLTSRSSDLETCLRLLRLEVTKTMQ